MGNYEQIKAAISAVIKTNGNQEITGQILQNVLVAVVNSLGEGAKFAGVATPTTSPGTPDQKLFYIAAQKGTYSNFGGAKVEENVKLFINNSGAWVAIEIPIPNDEKTNGLSTELEKLKTNFVEALTYEKENANNVSGTTTYYKYDKGFEYGQKYNIKVTALTNVDCKLSTFTSASLSSKVDSDIATLKLQENEVFLFQYEPTANCKYLRVSDNPSAPTLRVEILNTASIIDILKKTIVTPEMFGALADGVTNDYDAFLAAINTGKQVICNGVYNIESSTYETINTPVIISGNGTINYSTHIKIANNICLSGLTLKANGIEPNGLFVIEEGGAADISSVTFDGSSADRLTGGITVRGKAIVRNCKFFQSDININENDNTTFIIEECEFDANNANDNTTLLSNETIHIMRCSSGKILSCVFKNSKQDFIDFYFGAKNVSVENCTFVNPANQCFEIKAEYRDLDNPTGGNQSYGTYTSNIEIKNNHFKGLSGSIARIGTRTDERTTEKVEDGFFVRNVSFIMNKIDILDSLDKCTLIFARNSKNVNIKDNCIDCKDTSVTIVDFAGNEEYEYCDNYHIENNLITRCRGGFIANIRGNVGYLSIKNNTIIDTASNEIYIAIYNGNNNVDTVDISNNVIHGDIKYRLCAYGHPLFSRYINIKDQSFNSNFVAATEKLVLDNVFLAQRMNISNNVDYVKLKDCINPILQSVGYNVTNMIFEGCVFATNIDTLITSGNRWSIMNATVKGNINSIKLGENVNILNYHD